MSMAKVIIYDLYHIKYSARRKVDYLLPENPLSKARPELIHNSNEVADLSFGTPSLAWLNGTFARLPQGLQIVRMAMNSIPD